MDFSFAFGRTMPLLRVLGMGPSASHIRLTDTQLEVRMGWAFIARIPLESITGAVALDKKVLSIGVHGWMGKWLVNGAGDRLVRINIEPRVKAKTAFVPLKVRELTLSVEDPATLVAALS